MAYDLFVPHSQFGLLLAQPRFGGKVVELSVIDFDMNSVVQMMSEKWHSSNISNKCFQSVYQKTVDFYLLSRWKIILEHVWALTPFLNIFSHILLYMQQGHIDDHRHEFPFHCTAFMPE